MSTLPRDFDTRGFRWPGGPEYEPPPSPRCAKCGGFLPWDPDEREPWEDTIECDGSATAEVVTHAEAGVEGILGPGSFTHHYSPCGSDGGEHQPHTEVMAAGERHKTRCRRCGHVNVDEGW